jgi:hypothetical protein
LPDRALSVVETLGHIDDQIADLHRRVVIHTANAVELRETRINERFRLEVAAIAPLPAKFSRLTADILNGLRAALEHTLMAETIAVAGRSLTRDEERAVEFPAMSDLPSWARHRHRRSHGAYEPGSALHERIRELQPGDDAGHPLRLLIEYTNLTKHRVPAVVMTRQAATTVWDVVTGELKVEKRPRAIAVGDVIAETTNPAEVDSFSYVAVERPHTGEAVVLVAEIARIESWVREEAIPVLITGARQEPPLPSALPVHVGHADVRAALDAVAAISPAAVRGQELTSLAILRTGLREVLLPCCEKSEEAAVRQWIDARGLDELKNRLERLQKAAERGDGDTAAQQLIRKAIHDTNAPEHAS